MTDPKIYRAWVRAVFAVAESTPGDVKDSWSAREKHYREMLGESE